MKYCSSCGVEMVDAKLYGEPFVMDLDHEVDKFSIKIPTGETTSFLGFTTDKTTKKPLNVKVCPKCGKVEMFIQPFESKNN